MKKLTIEEMQELAQERGGKCLSQEYVNVHTRLEWECAEGHRWWASPGNVKSGQWCPECGGTQKLTLEEMQELAQERGGKCLSQEYVNVHTRLEWECAEGHRWWASPGNVKSGKWCPECGGTQKLTLEEMQELAQERGGKCLSQEYVNARMRLEWECAEGHRWWAVPGHVKRGTWCPRCSYIDRGNEKKLTIEEMQELAQERGGKCLSQEYVNVHTRLEWECAEGHRWWASPADIKNGTWCPGCAGNQKLTIEEMQELAQERGGKCLSQEYLNAKTGLEWECAEGHRWWANPEHVKRGHWCPECASYRSETICRNVFQLMFQAKFPKTKPKWLVNETGGRLELDGYCPRLGIAFEYQGEQHYRRIDYFHRSKDDFLNRKKDDQMKKQLCSQKGITLLEIPYTINPVDFPRYILSQLREKGCDLSIVVCKEVDPIPLDTYNMIMIEEMQELAQERGGKCLSQEYLNAKTGLEWECAEGHRWWARPNNVKRGQWCPKCGVLKVSEGRKLTIEEMQELAQERGGKCLSQEYLNAKTGLEWECAEGHRWWARPGNVKSGKWCPECARLKSGSTQRLSTEEMQEVARKRGGKCLSQEYVNAHTKLEWECAEGHRWWAAPGSVKNQGTWCPECARRKKISP